MRWVTAFMSMYEPQQSPTVEEVLEREVIMSNDLETTQPIPKDELEEMLVKIRKATIDIEDGKLDADVVFEGPAVKLFAAAAIQWFKTSKGENYVQCVVTDPSDSKQYTLTMQRNGGITPGEKASITAAELEQVRKTVAEMKPQIQQLIDAGSKTDRSTPQGPYEDIRFGAGAWLSPVEYKLRKMLAFRCSTNLYGDDGELTDSTMPFPIDWMRDSLDRIEEQLHNRGMAKLRELQDNPL